MIALTVILVILAATRKKPFGGSSFDACRFINYIMIELRSYNVERIWHETAICTIGNEVGVHKEILEKMLLPYGRWFPR